MARIQILLTLSMILWSRDVIQCGSIALKITDFNNNKHENSNEIEKEVSKKSNADNNDDAAKILPESEAFANEKLKKEDAYSEALQRRYLQLDRNRDFFSSSIFGGRWDPAAEQKKSDPNSPKKKESCYYPHRSNKPLYCDYYVIFGEPSDANKLIFEKVYKKPTTGQLPVEVVIEFRANSTIGYVFVEDTKSSKSIHDDDLNMKEGGVNYQFLKLIIKTNYLDPDGYRIAVYDKKPGRRF